MSLANYTLYQDLILSLNKQPLNYGKIETPCLSNVYHNSTCGDTVELYATFSHNKKNIKKILFFGDSCAITKASASLMTSAVKGKKRAHVQKIIKIFKDLLENKNIEENKKELGQLIVFQSIQKYPSRLKCANLPWKALEELIELSIK